MRDLRKPYLHSGELQESDLLRDPVEQLRFWFQEAMERVPVDWLEVNAATLATSSRDGYVTARMVLIKGIEEDGLTFFTNYDSLKGRQLEDNPRAAIVMYWPHVVRQVRIEGSVTRLSRRASEEYFHSRPRGSQIGAVVSAQSTVIADRTRLVESAAELVHQLGDGPVPMPENWGGYCLDASAFEFWQGRADRLHDRFRYRLENAEWIRERLAP